ncbi:MAG TPA: ATP-binding protein [Actinomycetota bacterium]|nr:ATP-binding protein [Actinomycetota bacterium]
MRGPSGDPELDIQFPPKPEYVRTVRHAVAALARLHGVSEDVVEEIKLAVSEACTIAVHANAELIEAEPVQVLAATDDDSFVIEILDRGPDPERDVLGDPVDLDTEDLPFDKGLALPVIRGLVDEVAVGPREDGGARVRMLVSIGNRR